VTEAFYAALKGEFEFVIAALTYTSQPTAFATGSRVGVDWGLGRHTSLVEVSQWCRIGLALINRGVTSVDSLIQLLELIAESLHFLRIRPRDILD
jgi:hypothetical protein